MIVLAIGGHNTVTTELKQQKITGTPDMTPTAIKAAGTKASLTQLSLFSLVVGIALILVGIGFIVLALGATRPGKTSAPS